MSEQRSISEYDLKNLNEVLQREKTLKEQIERLKIESIKASAIVSYEIKRLAGQYEIDLEKETIRITDGVIIPKKA